MKRECGEKSTVSDRLTNVDAFIPFGSIVLGMRIRDWQDILNDVIDSDASPDEWRAVAGNRSSGLGEDLYLGHPSVGLFLLKTYTKNPFDVKGVGTKIARKIDDDIDPYLPTSNTARFAIQTPPSEPDLAKERFKRVQETVRVHADTPTTPDDFFTDLMDALESPAFGPMEFEPASRTSTLDSLAQTFDEAERLLNEDLESLIEDDGIDRGFM